MDNTTLTILGMIAAFLTASITPILTESVKNRSQHKNRLHSLRVALYKEIWNNVRVLTAITSNKPDEAKPQIVENLQNHALRIECYKQVLQNEVTLFYELKEADAINHLQGNCIGKMLNFSSRAIDKINGLFVAFAMEYEDTFLLAINGGLLDKRVFDTFLANQEYELIMDRIETAYKD
jgi:hypothetical protein